MPKSVIFTRSSGRQQDVGRLHVAMHDAEAVRAVQRVQHLAASIATACGRREPAAFGAAPRPRLMPSTYSIARNGLPSCTAKS